MKRWTSIILPLAMISAASAFHKTDPPAGGYRAEQDQATVAHQQSLQGTFGEVGSVPRDTDAEAEQSLQHNDYSAARTLELNEARDSAKENLVAAEKAVEEKKQGKSLKWLWALIFGIFGFGVIAMAMRWADKSLPEPPAPRKGKK